MTLSPGTKLNRYEIRSLLGAGGMGEVYLARDPKIGRDVAVKVLPAELSLDKDRLARFEQEAQAAGALNHPNILSVFDVETHNGQPFVVTELLEGETLRERLDAGPILPRKTIEYAVQIANGLAAAHERGIIHRDLKPENIFITRDERVKILDFGLAKLTERQGAQVSSDAPTRKIKTDPGVVMGTAGYMSPEQVRGLPVDHRTDLFSFGTILYEMLTGRPAFRRDSTVETLNAILKEDPPEFTDAAGQPVPPPLESFIRHCLEKNPERRFYSAGDIAFALEALSSTSGSAAAFRPPGAARGVDRERVVWVGACALLLLAAGGLALAYFFRSDPPPRTVRLALPVQSGAARVGGVALSPDGSQLVFGANNAEGRRILWLRPLDSLEAQPLVGTEGATAPFWSPDNRHIGYFADGKLYKMDLAAGRPQVLCEAFEDRGGAWNRDGVILFAGTEGLYRISATGGTPTLATKVGPKEEAHRWPYFLPDGRHFVFLADAPRAEDHNIRIGSLDSEQTEILFPAISRIVYAPPGYLVYVRQGGLFAQKFDTAQLKLTGDPALLADQVTDVGPNHEFDFSVSDNGILVYHAGSRHSQLVWFDRTGRPVESFPEQADYSSLAAFPDGRRAIVTVLDLDRRNGDLWLIDFNRRTKSRLTHDPLGEFQPVISPDGSRVAFASNRNKGAWFDIYQRSLLGADEEVLVEFGAEKFATSWSADGQSVIFTRCPARGTCGVWTVALTGDRQSRPYLQSDAFHQSDGQLAPNGKYVAYVSDETGRLEIYVQSFPVPAQKWPVSNSGGRYPLWRADGRELFYLSEDGKLMSVEVKSGASFETDSPRELFQTGLTAPGDWYYAGYMYGISHDGQQFLINTRPGALGGAPLVVVLDWTAALER